MANVTVLPTEALLHRLVAHDVAYLFINSGTDHPPLIESIAKLQAEGKKSPTIINCPHENAAMGMANGYYFATGKPQAVMVHTNVGLANSVTALINAHCQNIPTILLGGRTPITEHGHLGSRNTPIGYGQEMRDQAALVRESVKWDFELRAPAQMVEHLDRAFAIAQSLPKGPVYLSLPREPLCEPYLTEESTLLAPSRQQPVTYEPSREALSRAAELLAGAKRPVIMAQRGAGSAAGVATLAELANAWGVPVVEFWATELAIASDDPMAAGGDPQPWLPEADVLLVIDSLAPWVISQVALPEGCQVIQLGPDPLFSDFPVRGYAVDVALAGAVEVGLELLQSALQPWLTPAQVVKNRARQAQVSQRTQAARAERLATALAGNGERVSKAFFSHAVGALAEKHQALLVTELAVAKEYTGLTRADSYYQEALSGGLGEGLPIALGAQLADRTRLVIAALGDGSYLFGNPAACQQISAAAALPILIVIANNARWGAVAQSVRALYPDGYAAKSADMPAVSLAPTPDFTQLVAASGGLGLKVRHGNELAAALAEAVAFIQTERRLALVEVPYL
ncbi:MAG: thiamine pyrophosphate-requiring protein [Neisseriaceae bacterium]|nr:thiamine pyrophosphate-requiring protein [Neisseriaceae bacterium]